jgi:hypothetical protein
MVRQKGIFVIVATKEQHITEEAKIGFGCCILLLIIICNILSSFLLKISINSNLLCI